MDEILAVWLITEEQQIGFNICHTALLCCMHCATVLGGMLHTCMNGLHCFLQALFDGRHPWLEATGADAST
jgi:hypothetical protein